MDSDFSPAAGGAHPALRPSGFCRKCGIVGDRVRLRWWQRLIPHCRRYYCAGCGKTFLSLF